MHKKIYLIDWNSFIYRMFFALPEFSTSNGKPVNATFGMAKFFTQQLVKEKPDYIVFIKDAKWDNFRHELYSEYKATREKMPDNLRSQIGDIEEMIRRMNIEIIEEPGFEADDVIATLAEKLKRENDNEIYILSGDKDLYALVDEQVKIYDTQKKKISGPDETYEKFGVPATCVRDYLAICWDSSDNIPWISGIWPKKAQVLLNHFEKLEEVYAAIDALSDIYEELPLEVQKIFKGKTLEKFIEGKDNAFLSQKLATLHENVVLHDFDIHDFEFNPKDLFTQELIDFFKELEFSSLIWDENSEKRSWKDENKKVQIIWDTEGLKELERNIFSQKEIVLDTETTDLDVRKARLVWISILLDENSIFYINFLHNWPQISYEIWKEFIVRLLESDTKIIGHNLKYDIQILENFLAKNQEEEGKNKVSDFWQIGLGI